MNLITPKLYLQATPSTLDHVCNGTGAAGTPRWLVRWLDNLNGYGVNFREASNRHDWMYHFGRGIRAKIWADIVFYINMIICIIQQKPERLMVASVRASLYFLAVLVFGWAAYKSGADTPSDTG